VNILLPAHMYAHPSLHTAASIGMEAAVPAGKGCGNRVRGKGAGKGCGKRVRGKGAGKGCGKRVREKGADTVATMMQTCAQDESETGLANAM
jgi:hypothetical protein